MRVTLQLSQGSIRDARERIQEYKGTLNSKIKQFVEELADYGISVAEQNTGAWGKHIEFVKEIEDTSIGCKAIMIMRDKDKIYPKYDLRPVSPSLMAEYGAGKWAVNGMRGTFPEQIHANDPKGWWYKGNDDKWHHSYGLRPTRPMYTAYGEMVSHINEVAKRVFG